MKNWQKQLKDEFGIHFKNNPDEFQFLEVFIGDLLKKTIQRFMEETTKELREELAELEHKQWESWTRYTLEDWVKFKGFADGFLSRLERKWTENWKPYSELTEEEKDKDRIWADKVLGKLKEKQAKWLKNNF